jgi:hypothetical protein
MKFMFARKVFDVVSRLRGRDRGSKGGLPFNRDKELSGAWIERSIVAAKLVKEHVVDHYSRPLQIADIGCGDCKLKLALAKAEVRCEYDGYDICPASPQVARFDVRAADLCKPYDLVAMLGVVEYLEEPAKVLSRLSGNARYILFSHVVADEYQYSREQMKELGWNTHLYSSEIEQVITNSGMSLVVTKSIDNGKTRLWLWLNSSNG